MKSLTITSSIASILSLLVTLLFIPPPYQKWGYISFVISLVILLCLSTYALGKRGRHSDVHIKVLVNRDEMLEEWPYRRMILEGTSPLLVLGGTLRSFVTEAHLEWIKDYVRNQKGQVRILMVNPSSQGSYLRAREEKRLPRIYNDLNATLGALAHFYNTLSEDDRLRVEIRKYSALPSTSMFIKGNHAAYTHYLHNRSATSSIWYLLERAEKTEEAFKKLLSHYESIWHQSIPISEPDNYAILFVGAPGTGKSTIANILHGVLPGANLLSSNDIRKENALLDIFSDSQRVTLQNIMVGQVFQQIALGNRRIILDTNLYKNSLRERLIEMLRGMEIDVYLFHLTAEDKDLLARIEAKCSKDELYQQLSLDPLSILTQAQGVMASTRIPSIPGIKAQFFYNTSANEINMKVEDHLTARYASVMIEPLQKEKDARVRT